MEVFMCASSEHVTDHICVILGDSRQEYLAGLLRREYLPVSFLQEPDKESLAGCSMIIAPTPFTKDQKTVFSPPKLTIDDFLSFLRPGQMLFGANLPQKVRDYCSKHFVGFFDFMDDEEIAAKNAVATAEGAVCEAIAHSPVNLEGSSCLLAGYGRCGRVLAKKLKALGAEIIILESDPARQNLAKKEGFFCIQSHALSRFLEENPVLFFFNTAPCPIFGEKILEKTHPDITIIDIASAPGGTDFDYCHKTGKTALLCPGLPGKYAPKTSAQILCSAVLAYLSSLEKQI